MPPRNDADLVEVAQRLQAFVAAADHQRQAHHGVEHARVERLVERGSDAAENAAADQVEDALGGVEAGRRESTRPTSVGTLRLGSTRS